jgi:dienelactone hydrolase
MTKLYEKWMVDWETRLTTRDTNRIVRPFDWGVEWTRDWPFVNGNFPQSEAGHERYVHELNQTIVENSDDFFSYTTPTDYRIETRKVELFATRSDPQNEAKYRKQEAEFLRFTSPVETPYAENNLMNARWFPEKQKKGKANSKSRRAVVLLPHWNSDAVSHNALCTAFNFFGIAALRMSMPYHDIRRPAELTRADYAVSANVGRTIDAARQAVVDIRCCLDWLEQQGYDELGIIGTSLGSCYAFLASAHDPRLKVNIFNHASTYFADVVWIGQSTRHIRAGVESVIDVESLRKSWSAISPTSYVEKYARHAKKTLVIYAKYDLTFPPQFSRQVVEEFKRRKFDFKAVELPCGHYTTGETPYKFMDGYHIVSYLVRGMNQTFAEKH